MTPKIESTNFNNAKASLGVSKKTINDLRVLMSIARTEKNQDRYNLLQQSIAHHLDLLTKQIETGKAVRRALAEEYLSIKTSNPNDARLAEMKLVSENLRKIPEQVEHLANAAKKQLLSQAPKAINKNPTRELLKSAPKAPTIQPAVAMMKDAPKAPTIEPVTAMMKDAPKPSKLNPEHGEKIQSIVEKTSRRERREAYKEAVKGMGASEMLEFNRAMRQELRAQKNAANRPRPRR